MLILILLKLEDTDCTTPKTRLAFNGRLFINIPDCTELASDRPLVTTNNIKFHKNYLLYIYWGSIDKFIVY